MRFEKHHHRPSTYVAEDNDSGHRYMVTKTLKGEWRLTIVAGGRIIDKRYAGTKKLLVEQAQEHNARLWIEQQTRTFKDYQQAERAIRKGQ